MSTRSRRAATLFVAVAALIGSVAIPGQATPPRATFTQWIVYHRNLLHTGYQPSTPPIGTLTKAWSTTLDAPVYAEPLVVQGKIIAATENDTVYALDPTTGAILWQNHLGTPVPLSDLPCGDIDPLGITGTPAYDPTSGKLFVADERKTQTGISHRLYSLDPATGAKIDAVGIDPSGSDPVAEQQRGAVAVSRGRVYVVYGALSGDCSDYRGYVVARATDFTGSLLVYSANQYFSGAKAGGIWATPGPTVDSGGRLWVSVGNGASTTTYDGSDSVLRLSPTLTLTDYFAPTTWASDNAADKDLGSQGPALVGTYVFADGKSGNAYLMNQSSLGHIGGQIASANINCRSFGGTAVVGMTVYVPCDNGVHAIDLTGGTINVLWQAAATTAKGPPVVGGGAVWSLGISDGNLYAISPDTGATITSISVGAFEHFATPTLSGGSVFVPTATGIVAVTGA
jgi:outer membrane protein assembly factor BamB